MKTLDGWNRSKLELTKYLRPGDLVDQALYMYCLEVVFPARMTASLLQMGEPDSHVDGQPTFCTFVRAHRGEHHTQEVWRYVGSCHLGKTEPVTKEESHAGG